MRMRLRLVLKIVSWSAAVISLAVLILGKEGTFGWIGITLIAAAFLHFLIETIYLVKRGSFPRRLADLGEFRKHTPFMIRDLESTLSSSGLMSGVSLPVVLTGVLGG